MVTSNRCLNVTLLSSKTFVDGTKILKKKFAWVGVRTRNFCLRGIRRAFQAAVHVQTQTLRSNNYYFLIQKLKQAIVQQNKMASNSLETRYTDVEKNRKNSYQTRLYSFLRNFHTIWRRSDTDLPKLSSLRKSCDTAKVQGNRRS